jgi:hypothetical protein
MAVLPVGIGSEEGGYQIERSLRFNSADSAYLNRTFTTPTSSQKFTWSGWIKRGKLDSSGLQGIFAPYSSGTVYGYLAWYQDGIRIFDRLSGGTNYLLQTTAVYRDPSAWYHIVYVVDTTQATASNRVRLYVNGVEVTSFSSSTYPTQNNSTTTNSAIPHRIGYDESNTGYLDGYQTEVNFIDGSALDPTSFGEFNTDTGVWQPKAYTGSYGTNGFYLDFADNSGTTSTTLGADSSGNGNNWTPNNFSVTAGAGNDSLVDSPTNNHATWNPLVFRRTGSYSPVFKNGNLYVEGQSTVVSHTVSTIGSSGKHYAEFLVNNGTSGITGPGVVRSYWDGGLAQSYASNYGGSYYSDDGTRYYNSTSDSQTAPGANRVGIEVDFANNEVEYFIVTSGGTRTSQGGKLTSANGINFDGLGVFTASLHDNSSRNITAFFDESSWWGTPNTGYVSLCTTNLPAPTIEDGGEYFNTVLYTGTGSARSVTGVGFQPDFVWIKGRSEAYSHSLADVIRGAANRLKTNSTDAEAADMGLTSFDSDGFSFNGAQNNESGKTYVSWNWKANGAGVSNTDGTITSTVSVNTTSGFSIVTYAGNSTAGATIGHGLGVAPSMVIVKARDKTEDWLVYHKGVASDAETDYLQLNSTAAASDNSVVWNDTAPTSTVFTVGADSGVNGSTYNYLAYCFAPVAGYSAFGSYTGNGNADGPFVYLGFRPRWVLFKRTDSTSNWLLYDTARLGYNQANNYLLPDLSNAEGSGDNFIDILSSGFKCRVASQSINVNSATYIFMAFAENPFSIALAR